MTNDDYTATLPRKRMAAAVLFRDRVGRSLLVEPTYKAHWEMPGGSVEADESPYDAAKREVKEELGVAIVPGRLLVVDWVPPGPEQTEGIMFVYDGGTLDAAATATIELAADELRSWAWCNADESSDRAHDRLARRLQAAQLALVTGPTLYLENGYPVA